MFIFQEKGACLITKKGIQLHKNDETLTGTFIFLQLNSKTVENIYDYLKYEIIHKKGNNE